MDAVRTLGHGTLAADAFAALVGGAGIEVVVDVRRYPGSRRFPHFGSGEMPGWLGEHGVEYTRLPALGGRRTPDPDSPNVGLRNAQLVLVEHVPVEHLFHDGRLARTAPRPRPASSTTTSATTSPPRRSSRSSSEPAGGGGVQRSGAGAR